jgi:HEAT repeat protein
MWTDLGKIGPEVVPVLVEALRDPDAKVRQGAAQALGQKRPLPFRN